MVPLALVVPTLICCFLRNRDNSDGREKHNRWFGRGSLSLEDQNDNEQQHEYEQKIVEVKTRRLRTVYMTIAYLVPQTADFKLTLILNQCFFFSLTYSLPFILSLTLTHNRNPAEAVGVFDANLCIIAGYPRDDIPSYGYAGNLPPPSLCIQILLLVIHIDPYCSNIASRLALILIAMVLALT